MGASLSRPSRPPTSRIWYHSTVRGGEEAPTGSPWDGGAGSDDHQKGDRASGQEAVAHGSRGAGVDQQASDESNHRI